MDRHSSGIIRAILVESDWSAAFAANIMQSSLVQEEWEQQTMNWRMLVPQGGVALAPKEVLPEILRNVGYTAKPTAIVITQDPDELGLRAYPRAHIHCRILVATESGGKTEVSVQRWQVQGACRRHHAAARPQCWPGSC